MKRIIKLILLLIVLKCFSAHAEQPYKGFEYFNWSELQAFQSDYLYSVTSLALVEDCPQNLSTLREKLSKDRTYRQVILGYQYYWTQFYDDNFDWCLVKHIQENTLDNTNPPPNSYEILSVKKAQVLLSAFGGFGFREKDLTSDSLSKKRSKIIAFNKKVAALKYKKYGGQRAVYLYIRDHQPALTNETLTMYSHKYNNPDEGPYDYNGSEVYAIKFFERAYSDEQKQSLIDKKSKRNYSRNHLKLLDKQWQLHWYQFKGGPRMAVLDNSTFYLKLDKEGYALRGSIDCNNFNGSYQLDNNKISIKQGHMTALGCLHPEKSSLPIDEKYTRDLFGNLEREKPYQQQSKSLMKLIKEVNRFKVSTQKLVLFTENGDRLFYRLFSP